MKFRVKDRALSAAVVVAALVVIVLAVLQYRWSNHASEATGVRLADTLQLSMVNWHLDFLRNFSEVCLTMRLDLEGGPGEDPSRYAQRFAEWRAVAGYPDLVSNVYLLQAGPPGEAGTLRLNVATRSFEAAEWPRAFTSWRDVLERSSSASAALNGMVTPGKIEEVHAASQQLAETFIGQAVRGWLFEPGVPALLHPIARSAPGGGWIVVELNEAVISAKILPDLAHRYFQGTDGLDYQVAVVAGGPSRRVIYSSDEGFGRQEVPDADGTLDVFGRIRTDTSESPIRVFHKTSHNRGSAAAAAISWFPLLRAIPADDDWQLMVRHRRGGPLGAFVAEMHRRDLAISFGALLLLVVSMTMLIITSIRAQRLAKLQMDFVTAVSHELRTPLSIISSAADNIVQGVVDGRDQVKQYGSVIGNQAAQLSGRVEQILLFAATEHGAERYTLQPLAVSDIVDATLTSTEGLIRAAHFTVERHVDHALPKVTGDLLALSQCLQNLITNALKYGRQGGWIGIAARLGRHPAGQDEVQISIADRGIGIDAADLPHVFEPFYRSRSVAEAQIRGTGLGLSLAKRIAEAMKGQLTVASEAGRGTTFTLHLPCLEQPAHESGREPNPALAAPTGHILDA